MANSFYEATITLILKPHKDITKKEYYRPILLTNNMQKYSIKYWQTKSKNTSKKVIYHDQVGFIPEIQGWFNI